MKMYIVKKSEYKQLEGKRIGLQSIGGSKNPKPKQKPMRDILEEILSTLKEHGNRLNRIDAKFIKQDELNQKFIEYMDKQGEFNIKVQKYMDKHP